MKQCTFYIKSVCLLLLPAHTHGGSNWVCILVSFSCLCLYYGVHVFKCIGKRTFGRDGGGTLPRNKCVYSPFGQSRDGETIRDLD